MARLVLNLIMLFLLFPASENLFGQSYNRIDSLHRLLVKADEDTNQVKILFKLCWEHMQDRTSNDSSRYYADKGLELSSKLGYEKGIIQVEYYYGLMDRLQGNYYSGLRHFQVFAEYHTKQGDSLKLANALYQMAVIQDYQGDLESSLRTYLRILGIYDQGKDDYMKATTLNSIGIIFKEMGNYDQAEHYYLEALSIFESEEARIDMADCLHNLGNVYALRKEYDEALDYFRRSLEIDESLENDWGVAYQLESIGTVYQEMGMFTQALSSQIRSLEIREKLQQQKELASSLNKVGMIYAKLGSFDKAIQYLNRSLEIADKEDIKPWKRDAYLNLADLHYETKDYRRAYEYQLRFSEISDSLFHEQMMKQINDLQVKYETDQKDREISALSRERELQEAKLLQQKTVRNSLVLGFVLLILIISVLLMNYRQKVKTREIIARKNEEINRQKIVELEKNQKLYALDAMITGQDVERKRIAQDLHDGLGALLSTIQMHFSSIEKEIRKIHQLDLYQTANNMLDEACEEVRKISHNMMPGTLMKFGLIPAIEDLCNKVRSTDQLKVEFNAFGMEHVRLDEHVEITIYRLIQEALNNVVKHAGASDVIVQIEKDEEAVHLTVEDDGSGFNVQEAIKKRGMGMRNLDSRVKYLNGRLDIRSEPGNGTSVMIHIPV